MMAHEFNAMDGHNIVVSVPDMVRGILEAKRKAFAPFLGEKLLSTAAAGN